MSRKDSVRGIALYTAVPDSTRNASYSASNLAYINLISDAHTEPLVPAISLISSLLSTRVFSYQKLHAVLQVVSSLIDSDDAFPQNHFQRIKRQNIGHICRTLCSSIRRSLTNTAYLIFAHACVVLVPRIAD